jgi:2-keto-3-deoxy-L-rhamnonate aldolase RhmA
MMTGIQFREALRKGNNVFGTLVTSSSPRMFDAIVSLEPDFVFLCTEHIFYNPDTLGWMCRAYKSAGINPVVRILKPDPYLATQALDSGACTVLAPYAEDIEQVLELVGAVKYRPLKGKKLKNILSGNEKPSADLEEYIRIHNEDHSLLLNIESPAGVMNMEQFFSIKTVDGQGVDGIVIGPHDLSVSYELPEKYERREFIDMSCDIIRKARNSGVAAGGHNGSQGSIHMQMEWVKAGANIIMHSSDIFLFADKYQDDVNIIRKLKGEIAISKKTGDNVRAG